MSMQMPSAHAPNVAVMKRSGSASVGGRAGRRRHLHRAAVRRSVHRGVGAVQAGHAVVLARVAVVVRTEIEAGAAEQAGDEERRVRRAEVGHEGGATRVLGVEDAAQAEAVGVVAAAPANAAAGAVGVEREAP
jgi:hypothetical protein